MTEAVLNFKIPGMSSGVIIAPIPNSRDDLLLEIDDELETSELIFSVLTVEDVFELVSIGPEPRGFVAWAEDKRNSLRGSLVWLWIGDLSREEVARVKENLTALGVREIVPFNTRETPSNYFDAHPNLRDALDELSCICRRALHED